MYRIILSHAAQKDLFEIREYIFKELDNEKAATNTLKKITTSLRHLENFAQVGALLSSICDVESGYRFLVCGKYLAFYRICEDCVMIDRIIYGKRDYLNVLFKDQLEEE